MISAFGVDHGVVSKRETVPDYLTPLLPASAVKAYDRSRRNKERALAENMGARVGGSAVGAAIGIGALAASRKRIPFLMKPTAVSLGRAGRHANRAPRVVTLSADRKYGFAQSAVAGAVGGAIGGSAGNASLTRIKREKKTFGYR